MLTIPFHLVGGWHLSLAVRPAGSWASRWVLVAIGYTACLCTVWHASFAFTRSVLRAELAAGTIVSPGPERYSRSTPTPCALSIWAGRCGLCVPACLWSRPAGQDALSPLGGCGASGALHIRGRSSRPLPSSPRPFSGIGMSEDSAAVAIGGVGWPSTGSSIRQAEVVHPRVTAGTRCDIACVSRRES